MDCVLATGHPNKKNLGDVKSKPPMCRMRLPRLGIHRGLWALSVLGQSRVDTNVIEERLDQVNFHFLSHSVLQPLYF